MSKTGDAPTRPCDEVDAFLDDVMHRAHRLKCSLHCRPGGEDDPRSKTLDDLIALVQGPLWVPFRDLTLFEEFTFGRGDSTWYVKVSDDECEWSRSLRMRIEPDRNVLRRGKIFPGIKIHTTQRR